MKNKYLSVAFLSVLLFSCNNNDEEIVKNYTTDFPNIDNTQTMGVGTTLSTPTSTNVKLDSMKMYYYDFFSKATPNLPGMTYNYETKESHPPSTLLEIKHYFTYEANGFVDIRIVEVNKHDWYSNKFKFVFDYDYNNENQLSNVTVDIYVDNEKILDHNLEYYITIEQSYLNTIDRNEYNIVKLENIEFATPKNVFNPERNLLPVSTHLQYSVLLNAELYNIMYDYDGLAELVLGYFTHNMYINTHSTFLKEDNTTASSYVAPLSNIQYKVRQDHYPEIIQYGNVYAGGYRFLYYYKN